MGNSSGSCRRCAMPWQESCLMEARMRFVARQERGERMTDLCEEFGISRKTGHKLWTRYRELGAPGLELRSRRPHRLARSMAPAIEQLVLATRHEHPSWGPRKLKAWLEDSQPGVLLPS